MPTDEQIKDAKIEMGEHFYEENEKSKKEIENLRKELEKQYEIKNKLHLENELGGIKIVVEWDEGYNQYVIHYPNLELTKRVKDMGIYDNVQKISKSDESATKTFEYAVHLAAQGTDMYALYKKMEKFIDRPIIKNQDNIE